MSMKDRFAIEIVGRPEFMFEVPIEDVNVLIKFAGRHYDSKCKAAAGHADGNGRINGILRRWQMAHDWNGEVNKLRERAGKETEQPKLRATRDELDLILKITEVMHNPGENDEENAIAWKYHFAFKRAMIHFNESLAPKWKEIFDAGPKS